MFQTFFVVGLIFHFVIFKPRHVTSYLIPITAAFILIRSLGYLDFFVLQGRVVKPPPTEKSYHIFYQMLAGLKNDERTQLGLEGYSVKNLHYLNQGDTRVDQVLDAQRFAQWRSSLAVLGIPLMDVLRVLSAILLLGNVEFYNNDSFEVDLSNGREEMETVARLLGVSKTLLWQGITTRTHTVRGQPVKSVSDANSVTLFC